MKRLDKVILTLFSILIFIEAIVMIGVILGWIDVYTAGALIAFLLVNDTAEKITLGVSIVFLLFAFKCIFFDSSDSEDDSKGVLMQNDNGKLLISSDTIENIVESVVKGFDSVTDVAVSTDLEDSENLIINLDVVVGKNVIIKELTLNMQNKIKEAIKKTSDLEVKEVNVKIEDIENTEEVNDKINK